MLIDKSSQPLVSIIVPTKNSANTLRACLNSIRSQSYQNFELIVVDNFSNDNTREIADAFGAIFYLIGPERCTQVNFGVSKAKGKYIYRVDSDFVLEQDVVKEAVECCEVLGYDAIIVHNTSDSSVSFWARVRKMERDSYKTAKDTVSARFLKKYVFESIGGFDINLVAGEDYDLQNRLVRAGYRVGRIEAQEIHVGEPKSLREIFLKHYYYGQNIGSFIQKDKRRALTQLSPFRFSVLKNFSKSYKEPILLLGYLLYQVMRYCAAGLGMLSKKLVKN
ncbi:MAG: glycosyltransferase [Candidatus Bathyarchaeota archaeon]|nr:glycosyltransferase [Candidatus Bathyarchaeota archaeon]